MPEIAIKQSVSGRYKATENLQSRQIVYGVAWRSYYVLFPILADISVVPMEFGPAPYHP